MENIQYATSEQVKELLEESSFNHDIKAYTTVVRYSTAYSSITLSETDRLAKMGWYIRTIHIATVQHKGRNRRGFEVFLERIGDN